MTELLVSVRSATEARVALASGAGLIDVKDPSRGSMGRADDRVHAGVLEAIAGKRPVSAALGELRDWPDEALPTFVDRLAYVKWGLANADDDWAERIQRLRRAVEGRSPCRVVLASYADHDRARAPSPAEVYRHAAGSVLLVDTFIKDGSSLLRWLTMREIKDLVTTCRDVGARIALAGSLTAADVESLLPLRPDWVAVRGAACSHGDRGAGLDGDRVRRLADLVTSATPVN